MTKLVSKLLPVVKIGVKPCDETGVKIGGKIGVIIDAKSGHNRGVIIVLKIGVKIGAKTGNYKLGSKLGPELVS